MGLSVHTICSRTFNVWLIVFSDLDLYKRNIFYVTAPSFKESQLEMLCSH